MAEDKTKICCANFGERLSLPQDYNHNEIIISKKKKVNKVHEK